MRKEREKIDKSKKRGGERRERDNYK